MKTTPRGLLLTILSLATLALVGCGQAPSAAPAPAPASNTTELGDPVTNAILGSTERTLQAKYDNASVVLAEQSLSTTAAGRTVCGRYILLTRDTRRDRFFIAKIAEVVELKNKTDPRWLDACATAKPLPGAVSAVEAEAQIASFTHR